MVMDTQSQSTVSTSARKVLIVDDEESLRTVLARQIDRLGYRTWQADGGERALALVATEVPDAVLVDLRMPGMDGLTFVRRLTALVAKSPGGMAKSPGVILMSGAAAPAELAEVLGLGASFLRKPWTREELAAALARALHSDAPVAAVIPPVVQADAFEALLKDFDADTLMADPSVTIGLWPDLSIGYFNPAYLRFARENGAPDIQRGFGIGSSLAAALPDPVKQFYLGHLRRVLETGQAWEHDYSCDSPTLERAYRMMVLPLGKQGLLLAHSLRLASVRSAADLPLSDLEYRHQDKGGLFVQCCQCRRLRRATHRLQWDFVPAALDPEVQKQVSHDLCPPCKAHYYSN